MRRQNISKLSISYPSSVHSVRKFGVDNEPFLSISPEIGTESAFNICPTKIFQELINKHVNCPENIPWQTHGMGGGTWELLGANTVLRGSALLGIFASQTASTGCSGKAVASFSTVDSSKRTSPDGVMKKRMANSDILYFSYIQ